jgi:hypothetical protein
MPQAVVAPRAEPAAPDVDIFRASEEGISDAEWSPEGFAKEDYGSDEDKCRDYLRTLKAALLKGNKLATDFMIRRREWHLVRAYIRGICPRRFQSCFVDRGWPMVETAEMMTDWATEPELGPSDTPLMKLAHEIVGLYKEVYYAQRRAEADRAADSIAAQKSLAEEQAAREKIASDLADQQAAWAAERATLLRDMAAALRDKDAAEHELASARRQAMDAALLLKKLWRSILRFRPICGSGQSRSMSYDDSCTLLGHLRLLYSLSSTSL